MKISLPTLANVAILVSVVGCSQRAAMPAYETSDEGAVYEERQEERADYKVISPSTVYESLDRLAYAASEKDSVLRYIEAFGIAKMKNEMVRRRLSLMPLDTAAIDSTMFTIPARVLVNAVQYDRYKTKTGDDSYYNAIYDLRKEPWEHEGDSNVIANTKSIVMVVPWRYINVSRGRYFVKTESLGTSLQLCETEKFYSQRSCVGQTGSGFIIASRLIATAFHCVRRFTTSNVAVILDVSFDVNSSSIEIPAKKIYKAKVTAINGGYDRETKTYPGGDFAVLETERDLPADRILTLVSPDTIPTEPIYMLGHPDGLTLKILSQGRVLEEKDPLQYRSEMHSMVGCSGAPVFSASTHNVIGIQLGRDAIGDDYVKQPDSNCKTTRRCKPGECEGMDLLKIEVIVNALRTMRP